MKIHKLVTSCLLAATSASTCFALPSLDKPVPLPKNFEGIITIYPDHENTKEVQRFWLIPSTARIVRKPSGKLAFGLVHAGVSALDPDGISALLNGTFQPYVDDDTLNSAKKLIQKNATDGGAKQVSFNFVAPTQTTAQILVGGQYIDWTGEKAKQVINGGSVEAGIPFQVKITDSFDTRCLSQAGGQDAALFGALFTMKFKGVGNRVHFKVTADFEETYKHVVAAVKGSGWFGRVSGDFKYESQELLKTGFVKLEVYEGTEEDVKKYHAEEILAKLIEQITSRTGLFAKTLKANGLPDAPGGGGGLGWSLSAGGGFETYTDKTVFSVVVDAQYTREQEIAFGMNFPAGGAEMAGGEYVKNLTDTNKPYPTSEDYLKQRKQQQECKRENLVYAKDLFDSQLINNEQYRQLTDKILAKGCYYSSSLVKMQAMFRASFEKAGQGNAELRRAVVESIVN